VTPSASGLIKGTGNIPVDLFTNHSDKLHL
jgi:hypothetical protein